MEVAQSTPHLMSHSELIEFITFHPFKASTYFLRLKHVIGTATNMKTTQPQILKQQLTQNIPQIKQRIESVLQSLYSDPLELNKQLIRLTELITLSIDLDPIAIACIVKFGIDIGEEFVLIVEQNINIQETTDEIADIDKEIEKLAKTYIILKSKKNSLSKEDYHFYQEKISRLADELNKKRHRLMKNG